MSGAAKFPFRAVIPRPIWQGLALTWIVLIAGSAAAAPTPGKLLSEPPSQSAAIVVADTGTAPAPAPAETPRHEWHRRLTGIVISPELRVAVFALDGDTRSVAEGQQIEGWVVTAIRPDGVSIEAAGETRLLALEASAPGKAQAKPGPDATQHAQKARSVSEALLKQKSEQAAAESALVAATAKMTGR